MAALLLIPIIFYTYNGVIGSSPDWINIAIFLVCAALAYLYEMRQLQKSTAACRNPKLAFLALGVIAMLFVIFTFATPQIGIFKDPITGTYGIKISR